MKNHMLNNILAIGFAALICSAPAVAQSKQTAEIPFAFVAGGAEFPEGNYAVTRSGADKVIVLTNLSSGRAAFVGAPIRSGKPEGASKLVFHASGDHMTLREVWFPGYPGMLTASPDKEVSAKVVVGMK